MNGFTLRVLLTLAIISCCHRYIYSYYQGNNLHARFLKPRTTLKPLRLAQSPSIRPMVLSYYNQRIYSSFSHRTFATVSKYVVNDSNSSVFSSNSSDKPLASTGPTKPTNASVSSSLGYKYAYGYPSRAMMYKFGAIFRQRLKEKIDADFRSLSLPAFLGLLADPLVSIFDGIYAGHLGAAAQAGMGVAGNAQYSVAKLYNDPLLKTSTSFVANKTGTDLTDSVTTAITMAAAIGVSQSVAYFFLAELIIRAMKVSPSSEMYDPAVTLLRWRAVGVPATSMLIVCNGIFRGRGDTKTPLIMSTLANIVNLCLSPLLVFQLGWGVSGAGLANALAQWVAVIPVLYSLHKSIPFNVFKPSSSLSFSDSLRPFLSAGGFILLRTIAKVAALSAASAAAATLGTASMAAYSLTYTLMFTASQLCDALAVSSQALLARDMPVDSKTKTLAARHVVSRALQSSLLVSGALALFTALVQPYLLPMMSTSSEVTALARSVMPLVLLAQVLTGLTSSIGGLLMGAHDWTFSTISMSISSAAAMLLLKSLPPSLVSIWISLTAFIALQAASMLLRIGSGTGPWKFIRNP